MASWEFSCLHFKHLFDLPKNQNQSLRYRYSCDDDNFTLGWRSLHIRNGLISINIDLSTFFSFLFSFLTQLIILCLIVWLFDWFDRFLLTLLSFSRLFSIGWFIYGIYFEDFCDGFVGFANGLFVCLSCVGGRRSASATWMVRMMRIIRKTTWAVLVVWARRARRIPKRMPAVIPKAKMTREALRPPTWACPVQASASVLWPVQRSYLVLAPAWLHPVRWLRLRPLRQPTISLTTVNTRAVLRRRATRLWPPASRPPFLWASATRSFLDPVLQVRATLRVTLPATLPATRRDTRVIWGLHRTGTPSAPIRTTSTIRSVSINWRASAVPTKTRRPNRQSPTLTRTLSSVSPSGPNVKSAVTPRVPFALLPSTSKPTPVELAVISPAQHHSGSTFRASGLHPLHLTHPALSECHQSTCLVTDDDAATNPPFLLHSSSSDTISLLNTQPFFHSSDSDTQRPMRGRKQQTERHLTGSQLFLFRLASATGSHLSTKQTGERPANKWACPSQVQQGCFIIPPSSHTCQSRAPPPSSSGSFSDIPSVETCPPNR